MRCCQPVAHAMTVLLLSLGSLAYVTLHDMQGPSADGDRAGGQPHVK